MNKTLLITIGVIFIALGALVFWLVGSKQQSQTSPSTTQTQPVGLPVAGDATQTQNPSQETLMSVATNNGGAIQTTNFMADPATVKDPINPGYYYLGYHQNEGVADPTATANPPYIIMYLSTSQYFNISLLQEPIGDTRAAVEQYLMQHLGITQSQMCELKYLVTVPDDVNSHYSGENLEFSFCPGATVLPQ